jgi:murein tripeptide amidase MpaA
VPMLNPDGVIVGNSQANLGGVDLDRKWGSGSSAEICPEVHYFQEYLSRLGGRKLLFIEI